MTRTFREMMNAMNAMHAAHALAASTGRPVVFMPELEAERPPQKRWIEPGATPEQRAITTGPKRGKGTRRSRRATK